MPKIINGYSGNESVADSLKTLGDSMFGNQAHQEVYRQTAAKTKRENENVPLLADALASGDYVNATRYGVNADRKPTDVAGFGQYYGVNKFGPGSEQGTRATMAVPGARYGNTVQGTREEESNKRTINDMTTSRVLAAEKYKHDNTPYPVYPEGVNGPSKVVSQSEAIRGGYQAAPLHKDQIIGGAIQSALRPAPGPAQVASVSPETPSAPAAPAVSPFANMSPDLRHAAGFSTANQMFLDPATHHVYLSQDGGQSILVGGQRMPIAGSSLQPLGEQQAAVQSQDNNVRQNVPQLAPAPETYSGAANDAARTSGALPVLKNAWNETAGIFGAGEMNPEQNRAKENLQNLAMSTRELIGNVPGRAAVQREKWANVTIPQPGALGITGINAEQQRNRVGSLTAHLRNIYAEVQSEASDMNTPPVERQKLVTYLNNLGRAIRMWEAPEGGTTGATPPQQRVAQPQAGGAQAAPASQSAQGASDPLSQARAAIAAGANRNAVVQRLQQHGINPAGL